METHIHEVNVCIDPLIVVVVVIRERPEDMDVSAKSGDGEDVGIYERPRRATSSRPPTTNEIYSNSSDD